MTTPLPPQPPHDDDALPGDAELKALYDRLPQHEPGPALDAAVLRAAAQAIERPTVTAHPRTRPRWPIALGTAATLVLAAGVAWQMRKLPTAAPVVPQASVATLKTATDTTPAPDRQADDAVVSRERKAAETRRTASTRMSAPAVKRMAAPLADRPATVGSGLTTAQPTASGAMSNRMRLPPALTARPPSTETRSLRKQVSSPAPATDERAAIRQTYTAAPSAMPVTPWPSAPAAPAQQPTLTLEPAATASPSQLTATPEPMLRRPPAPTAVPAPTAPMPQATPALVPSAPGKATPATAAMTREMQTIRTLYADGNATTARKLLDAFRQRHPHYELPADLRARLDDTP